MGVGVFKIKNPKFYPFYQQYGDSQEKWNNQGCGNLWIVTTWLI